MNFGSPDFTNVDQTFTNYDPQNYYYYGNYNYDNQPPKNNQGYFAQPVKDPYHVTENSHYWIEYMSKLKEAQREKLIEQLNLLPETGITLPPPSESSTRKAVQRPGYIKRPLNAFMIFSKLHRSF